MTTLGSPGRPPGALAWQAPQPSSWRLLHGDGVGARERALERSTRLHAPAARRSSRAWSTTTSATTAAPGSSCIIPEVIGVHGAGPRVGGGARRRGRTSRRSTTCPSPRSARWPPACIRCDELAARFDLVEVDRSAIRAALDLVPGATAWARSFTGRRPPPLKPRAFRRQSAPAVLRSARARPRPGRGRPPPGRTVARPAASVGIESARGQSSVADVSMPPAVTRRQRHVESSRELVVRRSRTSRRTTTPSRPDLEDRDVGVDPVDAADPGERVGARRHQLGRAVLGEERHHHEDAAWRRSRGPSRRRRRGSRRARRCASWRGRRRRRPGRRRARRRRGGRRASSRTSRRGGSTTHPAAR